MIVITKKPRAARARKPTVDEQVPPRDLLPLACKVFSATLASNREKLGDDFNRWAAEVGYPEVDHVDVRQSSDSEYHCLTLVVWYRRPM